MSRIGIKINVDVTKIDKMRLHKGEKGIYLDMVTFIDLDNQNKFGANGFITQEAGKNSKEQMPILGNCKIFWKSGDDSPGF